MRPAARLAVVVVALAACGKKSGGAESGSATPSPSAGPATTSHATDDALRTLAIPELAAGSRADNIPDGPLVVIGEKSIVLEGRAMVVVEGGKVDPAALQSDGDVTRIMPIVSWADSWSKMPAAGTSQAVLIAIDPRLPSGLVLQVIQSFIPSKQRDFALVVRTPDGPGAVPVHLPDAVPPSAPSAPVGNPDDAPVQLVLSLMGDRALLWSMSGLEGTLSEPRLELTPAAGGAWLTQLRDSLTDIAKRRWDGRVRPDNQKTIVVMVDAGLASGDLANAIAAVRRDAKGAPLFPDVQLSTGFDAAAVAAAKKPDEPKVDDSARRHDDAVALEDEAARYAMALVASTDDDDSSMGDMSRTRPGSDLAAQLDEVANRGATVAIGGGGGRGTRGDGDPGAGVMVGTGRGPTSLGPGSSSGSDGSDAPKTPAGRISISGKTAIDDTSLTVDAVLHKVMSAYMMGLKRCYKEQLKQDPTMRGAVTLAFTVNETGRVINGSATAMTSALGSCMEGVMSSWRFNVPKDGDGESTEASFRIKLGLVPD